MRVRASFLPRLILYGCPVRALEVLAHLLRTTQGGSCPSASGYRTSRGASPAIPRGATGAMEWSPRRPELPPFCGCKEFRWDKALGLVAGKSSAHVAGQQPLTPQRVARPQKPPSLRGMVSILKVQAAPHQPLGEPGRPVLLEPARDYWV
jgi:hypothetical protein